MAGRRSRIKPRCGKGDYPNFAEPTRGGVGDAGRRNAGGGAVAAHSGATANAAPSPARRDAAGGAGHGHGCAHARTRRVRDRHDRSISYRKPETKPLQSIIACNDSRFAICSESAANSRYGCRRLRRSIGSCFYIYITRLRRFSGRSAGPGLPHRSLELPGTRVCPPEARTTRPMRSPAPASNAAPSPNASGRTVKECRGTTGRHRRKIRSGTRLPAEISKRIGQA